MKYFKTLALLSLVSSYSFAATLVDNAEITSIATSSNGSADNFIIKVTGQGTCANSYITVPRLSSYSPEFFNRLYSTALAAYSRGDTKVRIVDTSSNPSCDTANYIELTK